METEVGTCDTCNAEYLTYSREGRCGNCGYCPDHCTHIGGALLYKVQFLNNLAWAQYKEGHVEESLETGKEIIRLLDEIDEMRKKQ